MPIHSVRLSSFDPPLVIRIYSFALLAALILASCATPMMPTGGPVDSTPPVLTSSMPETNAVRVDTGRIELVFSKPISEQTVRQALNISPDLENRPTIVVRGNRVEIRLEEALREETTYIVSLGSELQDLRNNRLPAPITIAFSTGDQLDTGTIEGWVRDPQSFDGVPNMHIFAYVLEDADLPDPRSAIPDYRTETDNQGRFVLSYLREGPYFLIALADNNRNRRADPGERFAVPPDSQVVAVSVEDTTSTVPLIPLFATQIDTLGPELVRVRPQSDRRFAVRFSEPIQLDTPDSSAFQVRDSLSGTPVDLLQVYADEDRFQLIFVSEPLPASRHSFEVERVEAVVDTVGNPVVKDILYFTPSTATDTTQVRFDEFEPVGSDSLRTLPAGRLATARFLAPPQSARDVIDVQDVENQNLPFELTSTDGIRYKISPETREEFQVSVRMPDSTFTMRFQPIPADSLGDVSGRILDPPGGSDIVIQAIRNEDVIQETTLQADSTFILRNLPTGNVDLRIFTDSEGMHQWFGGQLYPYRPPAILHVERNVRVRARWDSELDPISIDPNAAPPPVVQPTEPPPVDFPPDPDETQFPGFPPFD